MEIFFLVVAIVFAAGAYAIIDKGYDRGYAVVCTGISLVAMFMFGALKGMGTSTPISLDAGEVRELVYSIPDPDGNGGVSVLLRKPDGKVEFRDLISQPPKVFVAGENNTYNPYPPVVSTATK